jgi:hypothetical protein
MAVRGDGVIVQLRDLEPQANQDNLGHVGPGGEQRTLWMQRFAVRGDPATVDMFAANGTYLGTRDAGTPFPDAFYPDGRFVATVKDDLDLDHVVTYRLTE